MSVPRAHVPLRIALLGVGQVGGAVAALLRQPPFSCRFFVASGLVRDTSRPRPHAGDIRLTANPLEALAGRPDLVIEAIGGVEPARTLVLSALELGIPVVTANKSLMAAHGDVLLDRAARAGVPLRYEATVLAGVPFLGTFSRRSLARDITGFSGIVNGTTNFILSTMSDGKSFATALTEAQRQGYAEPDPANDVRGVDAAEKLSVLLRHFGDWNVRVNAIETVGIESIEAADLEAARTLNGALKLVVFGDWRDGVLSTFAGPAFLSSSHPLARVHGVQNALQFRHRTAGELFFAGPGAGPNVTAATLLDDAEEIAGEWLHDRLSNCGPWKHADPAAPLTDWFVRVSGHRFPEHVEIANLLSAQGVHLRSALADSHNETQRWFLTHACPRSQITTALQALGRTTGCKTFCARILAD